MVFAEAEKSISILLSGNSDLGLSSSLSLAESESTVPESLLSPAVEVSKLELSRKVQLFDNLVFV
jgi:hypothetical protein